MGFEGIASGFQYPIGHKGISYSLGPKKTAELEEVAPSYSIEAILISLAEVAASYTATVIRALLDLLDAAPTHRVQSTLIALTDAAPTYTAVTS